MATGFVQSQILVALLRAQVFDALSAGPMSVATLGEKSGLPHARLQTLLRAGAALDLLHERRDGRFGLGALGAVFVDNPGLEAMILHHDALYADLADPLAVVAETQFAGRLRQYWDYRGDGPAGQAGVYSRLMAATQADVAAAVLDRVEIGGARRWLDIGGGDGTFAIAAARRFPGLAVTVADLPQVAELARARVREAGLGHRVDVVAVDFFTDPLPQGYGAASLVRVLHDHDDAEAARILAAAAAALDPGGVLVVAEPLADNTGAGRYLEAYFNLYLLAMGQGRLRRPAEIAALLAAAGFDRCRRRRTGLPVVTGLLDARKPPQT